mmetsp:Transcript_31997/g.71088  ORF Transcript_31997/g.71088 Transcript_31997/m.71088 type:complete len:243 (+) Transcript_31997:157-885(+)
MQAQIVLSTTSNVGLGKCSRSACIVTRAYLGSNARPKQQVNPTCRNNFCVAVQLSRKLDLPQEAANVVAEQLQQYETSSNCDLEANLGLLLQLYGERAGKVVSHAPQLLTAELPLWYTFLTEYGAPKNIVAKVATEHPDLLVHTSIHTAGCTILFFKSMGWRNEQIIRRLIAYYPYLLARDVERDIHPVIEYLDKAGCQGEDLRLLLWEYPRIFAKDYRRQVRKFQYLSMYGLSLSSTRSTL